LRRPLSDPGFVGAGIGAALGGMRPIVEIMTVNSSLLALDQIMNNAATLSHPSGGQFSVALVIRMTTGAERKPTAQHPHRLEGGYAHIPDLRILSPATLEDARGMLWTALADPEPILIFEHGSLHDSPGEIASSTGIDTPESDYPLVQTVGASSTTSPTAADPAGCGPGAKLDP